MIMTKQVQNSKVVRNALLSFISSLLGSVFSNSFPKQEVRKQNLLIKESPFITNSLAVIKAKIYS